MRGCTARDATMEVTCFGLAGHAGPHWCLMGAGEDADQHRWYST